LRAATHRSTPAEYSALPGSRGRAGLRKALRPELGSEASGGRFRASTPTVGMFAGGCASDASRTARTPIFPPRAGRRWCKADRHVPLVQAAGWAIGVRLVRSVRLPLRVLPDRCFPAPSSLPGATPVQADRRLAVPKCPISVRHSATNSSAPRWSPSAVVSNRAKGASPSPAKLAGPRPLGVRPPRPHPVHPAVVRLPRVLAPFHPPAEQRRGAS
jgi:hypothetical protein